MKTKIVHAQIVKEKEMVVLQETYEDMTSQVDHHREKAESIRTQLDSERRMKLVPSNHIHTINVENMPLYQAKKIIAHLLE